MASRLNPYISFDGTARQAMEFYRDVFGGTLNLNTYGEAGAAEGADAEKIMHSLLDTDRGYTLMASDVPPGMEHQSGSAMTISLSGDDSDELRGYWDKLTAEGTISVPLEKQPWGDEFGICTDRFGTPWMVNISQPQP